MRKGTKGDLPDEVFEQMVQAQTDKSAMHQLYCQYLGARGDWTCACCAEEARHDNSGNLDVADQGWLD